jgi:hypothetical protein
MCCWICANGVVVVVLMMLVLPPSVMIIVLLELVANLIIDDADAPNTPLKIDHNMIVCQSNMIRDIHSRKQPPNWLDLKLIVRECVR